MNRLTDTIIRQAKATDRDLQLSDGQGLVLRVGRSSQSKDFFYRYKRGNSSKWVRLGNYPAMTLKEARLAAAAIDLARKQGIDPIDKREAESAQREAGEAAKREAEQMAASSTVRALFAQWKAEHLKRHKDGGALVEGQMARYVLPAIGDKPAADVTRNDIRQIIDALLDAGKERTAQQVFSLIRQLFSFGTDSEREGKPGAIVLAADPTAGMKKSRIGGKPVERERALSEAEIGLLASKLPTSKLPEPGQAALLLILATGARIGELYAAEWRHIDPEARTWFIPPERSKNGQSHTVFLSDFAVAQFDKLKNGSPWVLPNKTGRGPACPKSATKQVADRQRGDRAPMKGRASGDLANALALPGGQWRPHDLRRTAATLMAQLGIRPEVIERTLNHVQADKMARVYQRYGYANEMREAWQRLGDRLELLTSPKDNVVPITKIA